MLLAINRAICFFQNHMLKHFKCTKSTKETSFGLKNLLTCAAWAKTFQAEGKSNQGQIFWLKYKYFQVDHVDQCHNLFITDALFSQCISYHVKNSKKRYTSFFPPESSQASFHLQIIWPPCSRVIAFFTNNHCEVSQHYWNFLRSNCWTHLRSNCWIPLHYCLNLAD